MKKITPLHLGATLFVPATHKHVHAIAQHEKFPNLRSMVLDTEDGIDENALDDAINNISTLLACDLPSTLLRFIRPKNVKVLKKLLQLEGIEKVEGFVLPKFDENLAEYCEVIKKYNFYFMPSIEGKALFNIQEMQNIRDTLLPLQDKVLCIRFGAEDMLKQLALQRIEGVSLYEMLVPSSIISNLLMTFKPYNFALSAPVFKYYKDEEGFKNEVTFELQNGLVSKTIIHPNQIEWLNTCYSVETKELQKAEKILKTTSVGSFEGEMLEGKTQKAWAESILLRAKLYAQ